MDIPMTTNSNITPDWTYITTDWEVPTLEEWGKFHKSRWMEIGGQKPLEKRRNVKLPLRRPVTTRIMVTRPREGG